MSKKAKHRGMQGSSQSRSTQTRSEDIAIVNTSSAVDELSNSRKEFRDSERPASRESSFTENCARKFSLTEFHESPLKDISPANSQSSHRFITNQTTIHKLSESGSMNKKRSGDTTRSKPDGNTPLPRDREYSQADKSFDSISSEGNVTLQIISPVSEEVNNTSTQCVQSTNELHVKDPRDGSTSSTITQLNSNKHSGAPASSISTKKRQLEQIDDLPTAAGSAPSKKQKLLGIRNFFKPLPRSSSPPKPQASALISSDSIEPSESSTPPSSPPDTENFPLAYAKKSQRKQPRRLTTRPALEPLEDMSYHRSQYSDDAGPSFSEIVGGTDDPARVEMAEARLDAEERDDLRQAEMVSPGNRPRSDAYRSGFPRPTNHNSHYRDTSLSQSSPSILRPPPPRRFASNPGSGRNDNMPPPMGSYQGNGMARPGIVGSYVPGPGSSHPFNAHPRNRSVTVANVDISNRGGPGQYPGNMQRQGDRELAPYVPSHTVPIPAMSRRRNDSSGYQQLQLDLGLSQNSITCDKCMMVYRPSLEMDKRNHDKYCRSTNMPDLQQRIFGNERPIFEKIIQGEQHHIRIYGRTSSPAQRAHAHQVLDATYGDLPGLRYSDDELSSQIPDPLQRFAPSLVPRFKFYVYYIGRKVVGALLVERYHQFQTQKLVERRAMPPLQGKYIVFDRLWVGPAYRRMGYATVLADTARREFITGLPVGKDGVAMPEQTAMGRGFAGRYFA